MIEEVASRDGDVDLLRADQERFQRLLGSTGGLPVAIQLTADHIARFGVRFAADRRAPADEVVRRCIRRTLALLTPHEREVFELLGLTAGSFTIDLLAVYAGGTAEATQRLAGRLVDHGLLLVLDARFDLLPPIREGARSLLDQRGATDAALQVLIERSLATAASSGDTPRTSMLEDNLDTFAHLAWMAVRRPALGAQAVDLVHRLFGPMYEQLRQRELLTLLEALLATDSAGAAHTDLRTQAETARRAAICASECDTIPRARRWLDRAHALAERVDDRAVQARTWSTDAWLALDAGDYRKSVTAADRAITAEGDEQGEVALASMRCVAEAALSMGDLEHAEEVAGEVLARADGPRSFDGLLARTTLGWCLVERGKHAEAVSHARRLPEDLPDRAREVCELAVEADLIAVAADPRLDPVAPSLDNDQRFTWWMRLQQRVRLAARLPVADAWEQVLHTAADVLVLADLVPLAYPRLCATILLADAALAGGDIRQAARSYEQALRDAARGPNRLRGADALDGAAVLAGRMGHHQTARAAAVAAARIRMRAGAAPWPRPSLPSTVEPTGPVPDGWLRDGMITAAAIDEIAGSLRAAPRADPFTPLTHAERQIAGLVRRGMTNQEIADHLVISRRTVESHPVSDLPQTRRAHPYPTRHLARRSAVEVVARGRASDPGRPSVVGSSAARLTPRLCGPGTCDFTRQDPSVTTIIASAFRGRNYVEERE